MIHPHTVLRKIDDVMGYGVFATEPIPRGTIVYAKDQFDIEISPESYAYLDDAHRAVADKYSFMDERGVRIISWDHAKYVNHRCDCNTISTGYGFEIAVRDIEPGEEITDDYGLFNFEESMPLLCGCPECRLVLRPDDLDFHYERWDDWIRRALVDLPRVHQPLWPLLDEATHNAVLHYLATGDAYRSVYALKRAQAEAEIA